MRKTRILVVGANGQIGAVLTSELQAKFGSNNIIPTDIRPPTNELPNFEILDITDRKRLEFFVEKYQVTQIYHLAAILSAKGESNPLWAWNLNMTGLINVLETARTFQLEKVFFPSSIAVFGADTPRKNTPQQTIMTPSTVYGMSKLAGENWCNYYYQKHNVDVRSLRYPGIIGYQSLPGGGTTDYAVEIYHAAVKGETYTCFLKANTRLPMLYMSDAIRATIALMDAPTKAISIRTSYNLSGMDFTPSEVAAAIQQEIPDFNIEYQPDFRQAIADSWTESIDDSQARQDWGWKVQYDLPKMTKEMLFHLRQQYSKVTDG